MEHFLVILLHLIPATVHIKAEHMTRRERIGVVPEDDEPLSRVGFSFFFATIPASILAPSRWEETLYCLPYICLGPQLQKNSSSLVECLNMSRFFKNESSLMNYDWLIWIISFLGSSGCYLEDLALLMEKGGSRLSWLDSQVVSFSWLKNASLNYLNQRII